MNETLVGANLTLKIRCKLHRLGIVDFFFSYPINLTVAFQSSVDCGYYHLENNRLDVEDRLTDLVVNDLKKQIEDAGLKLPLFGVVFCYPYFSNGRIGVNVMYAGGCNEDR